MPCRYPHRAIKINGTQDPHARQRYVLRAFEFIVGGNSSSSRCLRLYVRDAFAVNGSARSSTRTRINVGGTLREAAGVRRLLRRMMMTDRWNFRGSG